MKREIYQIREYESFVKKGNIEGFNKLSDNAFTKLEKFVLSTQYENVSGLDIMTVSYKKGVGKVITAKNYVGIIMLNDNITIEILPKIHSTVKDDTFSTKTKAIFFNMLKCLPETPFKSLQTANVALNNVPILEVFIRCFLYKVSVIVKKGIKCNYESIEENSNCLKGKMLFESHIKANYIHKERSYVKVDFFTINRPENRLIKATLLYLYKKTTSEKIKNDIKVLLGSFSEIAGSVNYEDDFRKCILDRNTKDYFDVLNWSKAFLEGNSFTPFYGSAVSLALLFPMERLFESYIAKKIRRLIQAKGYIFSSQDRRYYLFDEPKKRFLIKPDIVIEDKHTKSIFILDTKWKLLDSTKANYGISQSDVYQMYAYQKKYRAKNITLVYPMSNNMNSNMHNNFISKDGFNLYIYCIDLFDIDNSISKLLNLIFESH